MDHINRVNSVKLCLNIPLLCSISEAPKKEIVKQEHQDQWDTFMNDTYAKYMEIMHKEFYMDHAYDCRGRCYAQGYLVSYQGSSFKKSIVQFANKEVVKL